jgi:hypothetical protein
MVRIYKHYRLALHSSALPLRRLSFSSYTGRRGEEHMQFTTLSPRSLGCPFPLSKPVTPPAPQWSCAPC